MHRVIRIEPWRKRFKALLKVKNAGVDQAKKIIMSSNAHTTVGMLTKIDLSDSFVVPILMT